MLNSLTIPCDPAKLSDYYSSQFDVQESIQKHTHLNGFLHEQNRDQHTKEFSCNPCESTYDIRSIEDCEKEQHTGNPNKSLTILPKPSRDALPDLHALWRNCTDTMPQIAVEAKVSTVLRAPSATG
ncbi:hypothetical protein GW17_00052921 [Ensete ventricosum]|nr:hypothetical protein GW17_00052921 [Ensete ventricosum]